MRIDISTPLASALTYLAMGLSVFPLALGQKKPVPSFKWESLQHTLPTKDQVKSWFSHVSDVNIAIATGTVSRLLAFDIDGAIAKSYVDDVIQNKISQDTQDALTDTLMIETGGGGIHFLLRYNPKEFHQDNTSENAIKNAVLWRGKDGHNEIRLKGDGGYIVAAPSLHPNGSSYRLLKGTSIAELSKEQILDLIQALRQIGGNHNTTTERKAVSKQDYCDKIQRTSFPTTFTSLDAERVMDIVVILKPYYLKGQRHEFILYLSGWLRKEGIEIGSSRKVVEELAENDEELTDRLATLNDTYQKIWSDDIRGFSGLVEILAAQVGYEETAKQILREIQSILPIQAKKTENYSNAREYRTEKPYYNDADETTPSRTKKVAKKIIDLVNLNCPLLFVDQYNKPHVWATVVSATGFSYRDVIPLESKKFETYISGLYYTNTDGEVANKEAISDTIRILAAKALYKNQTTKELHLRVAWNSAEKQEEIYYDLTDQKRRCVRITSQGWQIIPHTEDVLFRRFGQLPQVEPSGNYPPEIFDQLLDLMHITDPQQRLLNKVRIISYFIPDIAHPIDLAHGEKGSVKTTFCRCIKRLVDPAC